MSATKPLKVSTLPLKKSRSKKDKWVLTEGSCIDHSGDHWKTTVFCSALEPQHFGPQVKVTVTLVGTCRLTEKRLQYLGFSERAAHLLGECAIEHKHEVKVNCPFEKLASNAEVLIKKFQEHLEKTMDLDKKRSEVEKTLSQTPLSGFTQVDQNPAD